MMTMAKILGQLFVLANVFAAAQRNDTLFFLRGNQGRIQDDKVLSSTLRRFLQDQTSPVDAITSGYEDSTSFEADLSSPDAGKCLGIFGTQVQGKDLTETFNCDSLPLGRETSYNLLQLDFDKFLEDSGLESLADMFGLFGFDLSNDAEALADLPFTGSLEEGFPLCLVCNNDMFAVRVQPGLPRSDRMGGVPIGTCSLMDGFYAGDFPAYNLAVRFQFVGVGVAWRDGAPGRPNLPYGTARNTDGNQVNSPMIYDGLTQVPLQVPNQVDAIDFDFWLSVSFNFLSLANHQARVNQCLASQGKQTKPLQRTQNGLSLKFTLTADLYINTSPDEICVLVVVPVALLKVAMLPVIDVGSAIGGYCRLPNDRCVPDGFFLNVAVSPSLQNDIQGVLGDILSSVTEVLEPPSRGGSLGLFLDKTTAKPMAGLLQAWIEAPKFLGLSLGQSVSFEFQYISNEGRWQPTEYTLWVSNGILQKDMPPHFSRCIYTQR